MASLYSKAREPLWGISKCAVASSFFYESDSRQPCLAVLEFVFEEIRTTVVATLLDFSLLASPSRMGQIILAFALDCGMSGLGQPVARLHLGPRPVPFLSLAGNRT